MKTINLRWMYPHYRHDEFVDVTDEVWAAMYQAQREMENYERRKVYHRASDTGPPCSHLLYCWYQAAGNRPERGYPQQ